MAAAWPGGTIIVGAQAAARTRKKDDTYIDIGHNTLEPSLLHPSIMA